MEAVIPPKRNRKEQRDYDRHLYKVRHLVENAFLHLIVEQFKKRTRTYRVRQVGRRYATQLYERVTLFLKLFRYKRWRGIATRYAKTTASFLVAVHVRCIAIWLAHLI